MKNECERTADVRINSGFGCGGQKERKKAQTEPQQLQKHQEPQEPLGIYLHIPFCVQKCAYCDFLSAPADEATREQYVQALCRQIETAGKRLENRHADSVFLGGGTPTVLSGGQLTRILSAVQQSFLLTPDAEITVECNPGTADPEKLLALAKAGVNRLSIGLQSSKNEELRLLGRIHTWEAFLQTYQWAKEAGIADRSIDLISALPGQTADSFREVLDDVQKLQPEHLSVYSLIVEEGTPFYNQYAGGTGLPSEEEVLAIDRMVPEVLAQAGYERYEISNYAKPGHASRHNLKYWSGGEYLGLGLGASSYLRTDCGLFAETSFSIENGESARYVRLRETSDLKQYLEKTVFCPEEIEALSLADEMEEYAFLGLRKCRGFSEAAFEARFGVGAEAVFHEPIRRYRALGLLKQENGRIFLTPEGLEVSNQIMADFLLTD